MVYIKSFFFSLLLFIGIFEGISYIKFQPKEIQIVNQSIEPQNTFKMEDPLLIEKKIIECLKQYKTNTECSELSQKNKLDEKSQGDMKYFEEYIFFSDLLKSHFFIKIIYFLLVATLAIQINLYLLSGNENYLNEKQFHLSELSINSSPMLGLLGTFFSISILLGEERSNLSERLVSGFFDAVMTTIIGIIFYLISFYLKVYIYPKVVFDDQKST